MESLKPSGYSAVLRNRNFLAIWMAQVLSNTALNGSFFLQIILIEQVTRSSAQLGAVILAFSLPAVLLSAIAGMVVDRVPKKSILIASNALRVVTGVALAFLASFLLTHQLNGTIFLIEIYILVFVTSAIGQFFAPAEGSTIPLLVRSDDLLPANSLFTITFTASQILGTVILAPLGAKTIGIVGSLWLSSFLYLGATFLVMLLPQDQPIRTNHIDGISTVRQAWHEIREGWRFAITHRSILPALLQLALISMLTMVMAELAPGFAVRVLGMSPEDAIYVFWPAGAGMLIASIIVGRYGNRVPREILAGVGIVVLSLGLGGLAWAGGGSIVFGTPLFVGHPELVITTAAMVMLFALLIGMAMAMINIPAQTIVQEQSNNAVRGRVLAVQFTLSNALGIPPLLFTGILADIWGIPLVTTFVALLLGFIGAIDLAMAISAERRTRLHRGN